jgi:putative MFS transporter
MTVLILLRLLIGIGLGAENVVGYSTMTEFVPAASRGRWLGLMAVFVVTGLPIASLVGWLIIPLPGWRAMFVIGGLGALTADAWGRKPTIIGASALAVVMGLIYPNVSDPAFLLPVGFLLTVPIYVLVALLFAIYIPELFPTEIRLRASGICQSVGRGATIVTPFIVVWLFTNHGIAGVMALMVGLLILQIIVVALFGIEPRNRRLEDLDGTPRPRGAR